MAGPQLDENSSGDDSCDLPVGRYTIEVVKELFEASGAAVELQAGGAPLRIPLSVGVVRESVVGARRRWTRSRPGKW